MMSASILFTHLALLLPVLAKLKTESLTWLTACFWHKALLVSDGKRRKRSEGRGGRTNNGCQEVTAMEMSYVEEDELPGT